MLLTTAAFAKSITNKIRKKNCRLFGSAIRQFVRVILKACFRPVKLLITDSGQGYNCINFKKLYCLSASFLGLTEWFKPDKKITLILKVCGEN
jgi:hypothetical protein